MWWWRKIRYANIASEKRNKFEIYGENVISQALATPTIITFGGDLPGLIRGSYQPALDWLTERRDIHERREDRLETVEWAILIVVVFGVIADIAILGRELHWF